VDYSFDIEHAQKYGVDEAIIIKNFQFWLRKNKANNKNIKDGRAWTFNSVKAFGILFPFWSSKQIRRTLESLVNQGIIITGNYNKIKNDRTKWYAFQNESIFLFPERANLNCPEGQMTIAQTGEPLPDIKPDDKPINNIDSVQNAYKCTPEVKKDNVGPKGPTIGKKSRSEMEKAIFKDTLDLFYRDDLSAHHFRDENGNPIPGIFVKESPAVYRLIDQAKARVGAGAGRERIVKEIENYINAFNCMRSDEKHFLHGQLFLPSIIASPKIFARVVQYIHDNQCLFQEESNA
jgi:hypothetical protein